tara:strand:- start:908 stop:1318 length:411 start_codon:yes stop_codon:yes gene_type:complete
MAVPKQCGGGERTGGNALGVELPLSPSSTDGWQLITSIRPLIRQNLRMIIMTNPGERVMEPLFGVGINSYVFRNFHATTYSEIEFKIKEQVTRYLPAVTIDNIIFDASGQDFNKLYMKISYSVPKISVRDVLEIIQ